MGYSNPKDAIAKHCRADGVAKRDLTDSLGRKQKASYINEGNVFRLITHSKLPSAEKFESWVFDEVLPAIRKTGSYSVKKSDDYKQRSLFVREMNARARLAQTFERLAKISQNNLIRETLVVKSANAADGTEFLPLPQLPQRTYSAGEVGENLGVSKKRIGMLAVKYNLKTEKYGAWFSDFVPQKGEVQTFRYYECAIEVFRAILETNEKEIYGLGVKSATTANIYRDMKANPERKTIETLKRHAEEIGEINLIILEDIFKDETDVKQKKKKERLRKLFDKGFMDGQR